MTAHRYAVRALALSLSLTAVGAFGVVDATSPAHAVDAPSRSHAVDAAVAADRSLTVAAIPVGGQQLAARGIIVNLSAGVPAPPAMPGASFLVADMDTGKILVAKAPHTRRLPASTLKTLTALTLIPRLEATRQILVKPADVRVEGSSLGLLPGRSYSAGTLLQGLLMVSGNDAAYALARANQSRAVTLKQMNATAVALSAFDTVAKDPSGLDKVGQTSSAYDLALIGRAAMKLPDFRRYVGTKRARLEGGLSVDGKLKPSVRIGSHNRLLYNYQGTIGIKTGFTNAAKHTFVGAATRGGKTYIVSQMASPNGSWRPTAALLDWAFAYGSTVSPIGDLVEPASAPSRQAGPGVSAGGPAGVPAGVPPLKPTSSAHPGGLSPWVSVTALISAVALVGAWTRRKIILNRG